MRWPLIFALLANSALAEGEPAGEFDYYVLSLSWSPNWCAMEGRARQSRQCDQDKRFGWVLHGLWPQNETGWPSFCRTTRRDPDRRATAAMADIMGTSGLAWYQWRKHGRCTGLDADSYFALSRDAFDRVVRPAVLGRLDRRVTLPARLVEEAFLAANPGWSADMLTITCKQGHIREARLCLTRDLEPRECGADAISDCSLDSAIFEPAN